MKNLLSEKAAGLKPSGIRKFFDIVSEMDDVISLGVGEPDFDTPWAIRDEGIYTLEKGRTFYTSNAGMKQLREEIAAYLRRRFGLQYDPENEIFVTVGGSEGIDMACRALLNPGDEVLIPEPCYVSYVPCVLMAGGKVVSIPLKAENEFRLTPEELLSAITDKTKLLVMPFPNNPTGAVMERKDLEAIAKICIEKDIYVLSDEIYAELTYIGQSAQTQEDAEAETGDADRISAISAGSSPGREPAEGRAVHVSIAELPGMKERTILINGFSKAYAMTGWRLGYACGPREILDQMIKLHQYCIMCAPTNSQYAAVVALRECDDEVAQMREAYNQRRRFLLHAFQEMGLPCFEPYGAFYVFPCIKEFGMTSEEFALKLLEEEKVAVVPGDAFGDSGEGFIRISYAYSIDNLRLAMQKISAFVTRLREKAAD